MKEKTKPLLVILGPTATGKTLIAAHVAAQLDGEVVSADSRQVYKGMDLGTGKDYEDYMVNGVQVPYHLIDIAEPGEEYNLFRFQQDCYSAINQILVSGKFPVVCGGTGLYLQSIIQGYRMEKVPEDKALRTELEKLDMDSLRKILFDLKVPHNVTDLEDRQRLIRAIEIAQYYQGAGVHEKQYPGGDGIPGEKLVFGIHFEREIIRKRITQRLEKRLQSGMIDEVNALLDRGLTPAQIEFYGLEYRYVTWFLTGRMTYQEMFEKLNTAIHQFAKRQMTWYRKMEREGVEIKWIEGVLPLASKVQIICGRVNQAGDKN